MLNKEQVEGVVKKYKLECWLELNSTNLTVTCLGNWEGFGFALWYETDTFEYRLTGSNLKSFNANGFLDFSDDYLEAIGISTNWYHRWLPVIDELMQLSGMKIEPTVTEQINAILKVHKVEQSDDEAEKTCITEDGFARIYAADLVIVIQPEEELMHISTLEPPKTFTHDLCEWDEMSVLEFPAPDLDYILWTDHLKRALFEIIDVLDPRQDAGMDEDRIPDDSDGSLPPNPNDYPPNNGEPTYDQLKKQVEELHGKNEDLERQLKELDEVFETVRTSKNRTIKNLQDKHGDLWRRLNIYQFAHEEDIQSRMNAQKGVTSDS